MVAHLTRVIDAGASCADRRPRTRKHPGTPRAEPWRRRRRACRRGSARRGRVGGASRPRPRVDACSWKSQRGSIPAASTTLRSCTSPQRPRTCGVRRALTRLPVSSRRPSCVSASVVRCCVTAPYASWRTFSIPLICRSIRSSESFSGATWPLICVFATSRNDELVCWSASDESARNASRASVDDGSTLLTSLADERELGFQLRSAAPQHDPCAAGAERETKDESENDHGRRTVEIGVGRRGDVRWVRSPPMARKDRVPNPPKRPAGARSVVDALGSGDRRPAAPPALHARGLRGGRTCRSSSRSSSSRAAAATTTSVPRSRRAGCTLQSFPAPGEQVRPLRRTDARDEAEMELLAADERPALRRDRGLGLVRRAGAARADGAQPRARRRRHPLRPRCPGGGGRQDPRRGTSRTRTAWSSRRSRRTRTRSRSLAWTAPDAASGTRDRGRGWLATCTKFDEDAFDAFIEEHRYKGPERLLPEQLAPGT